MHIESIYFRDRFGNEELLENRPPVQPIRWDHRPALMTRIFSSNTIGQRKIVALRSAFENCVTVRALKKQLLDFDQWSKVEKTPLAIAVDSSLLKTIAQQIGRFDDDAIANW